MIICEQGNKMFTAIHSLLKCLSRCSIMNSLRNKMGLWGNLSRLMLPVLLTGYQIWISPFWHLSFHWHIGSGRQTWSIDLHTQDLLTFICGERCWSDRAATWQWPLSRCSRPVCRCQRMRQILQPLTSWYFNQKGLKKGRNEKRMSIVKIIVNIKQTLVLRPNR